MFNNNKVLIILVAVWLLLISATAFYFLGIFNFLDIVPRETYEASFYTSTSKHNFQYLSVFAIVNGLLVFAGLRFVNFAKTFSKYIDPVVLLFGIIALIAARIIPCEGLACIGNGFLFMGGAAILGSVFVHFPLLYLISKGINKLIIGLVTTLFILTTILLPFITYTYQAKSLPKKAEAGISQAKKDLSIMIFKPNYLPDKEIDKQFEGVNKIDEYYLDYYYKGEGIKGGSLNIKQSKSQGRYQESLTYDNKKITINNNPATVSTNESIQKDGFFFTDVIWMDGGTEIFLKYSGVGTAEAIESEAIKIAESMIPSN